MSGNENSKKAVRRELYRKSLKHEAKLNKKLVEAALAGNDKQVKSLLDAGADINFKCLDDKYKSFNDSDRFTNTALIHAIYGGHKNIVAVLIERGADCNMSGMNPGKVTDSYKKCFYPLNIHTPLEHTIKYRNKYSKEIVQLLLKGGAEIYGATDLIEFAKQYKAYEELELILEKLKKDKVSEEQYHDKKFRFEKLKERLCKRRKILSEQNSTSVDSKALFFPKDDQKDVTSTTQYMKDLTLDEVIEYLKENSGLWQQLQEQLDLLQQVITFIKVQPVREYKY